MRVLLVEDDESIAAVVTDVLAEERHEVTRAASRGDGLELAASQPFDLVLTDSFGERGKQPSSGDLAALHRLAGYAPVVLVTAHGWARRLSAAEVGVAAIVRKPFDLEELLAVVRDVGRAD